MPDPSWSPYFGEGILALADGRVFRGLAFGARTTAVGEVVFNTAMTGYQEIITDPSYAGQLVCLTVSEVGNVGTNALDAESDAAGAEGLIVRSLSPVVSSWRAEQSLPRYLEARGMPGLGEIDTRALTRHLRQVGAIMGVVSTVETDVERLVEQARKAPPMEGRGLAHEVSTPRPYAWTEGTWEAGEPPAPDVHVVAYDFGIKRNILRNLVQQGIRVTVVPSTTPVDEVMALRPDGVFLSNGPGDPAALVDVIERTADLLGRDEGLPVFGICLGHQLMCLALGGKTYKLKFGHHGGNHPVRDEGSAAVEITSQNHGFAVDAASFSTGVEVSHQNLFDRTVAGLRRLDRPHWGVQYHPEASPGPHDSTHLFAEFAAVVRGRARDAAR
ncbi:MAG: glutamine-hydrolyzing carbamoyl-phosphate synthase small subunit [Myxococcales bacterium]|nr:glutamine-hydrolyzing carbamoyl-phosphate synthase small subunit [Myxococcales bacterium]